MTLPVQRVGGPAELENQIAAKGLVVYIEEPQQRTAIARAQIDSALLRLLADHQFDRLRGAGPRLHRNRLEPAIIDHQRAGYPG